MRDNYVIHLFLHIVVHNYNAANLQPTSRRRFRRPYNNRAVCVTAYASNVFLLVKQNERKVDWSEPFVAACDQTRLQWLFGIRFVGF